MELFVIYITIYFLKNMSIDTLMKLMNAMMNATKRIAVTIGRFLFDLLFLLIGLFCSVDFSLELISLPRGTFLCLWLNLISAK